MTAVLAGSWLDETRRDAWTAFRNTPDPARTVETWRRVPFASWRLNRLTDAEHSAMIGSTHAAAAAPLVEDAAGVLRQDGNRGPVWALDSGAAKQGVILISLEEAAARYPEKVQPCLKNFNASSDFRRLEAANLAQFHGGAFLYIPKGVHLDKPIDISFLHNEGHQFAFPRVLVVAEAGSEVTVVEDHVFDEAGSAGATAKLSSIAFSHVTAGRDAKVRYFYLQSLSLGTSHFWYQRVDLAQNAQLKHYSTFLGGAVHKSELDVRLLGSGARSELFGALFGTKGQLFDPHTAQDHRAPSTSSDLLYRSALKANARCIYTGLIRVEKEAKGTEAYQQNNNILLSNNARADSTPVLEILTDEVRCKHGATVGPINPEELFYLESRGMSPDEAAKMLLMGFFQPVLGELPLLRLMDRVPGAMEERITQ